MKFVEPINLTALREMAQNDRLTVGGRSPKWGALKLHHHGIAGVVLDAVGTLITPVPSVAQAYTAAAERQGVILEIETVRARFHIHFQRDSVDAGRGALSTDEDTERQRWYRIVRHVLPEVPNPDRAFHELWQHFGEAGSWRSYPDAPLAMHALSTLGISICVGSNFDRRLRGVLSGLPELAPWLDDLVISSEVGYRKPHPSFFRAVCEHLGLAPAQVLCVGDDLENDVRGAINAGLAGILLHRGTDGARDLPHVPNLTALVEGSFI
jgi:putative hydrolase of the HAD superfamily